MPHWMLATTTWQNDVDFPLGFVGSFVVLQPNMVINIYMCRLKLCFLSHFILQRFFTIGLYRHNLLYRNEDDVECWLQLS